MSAMNNMKRILILCVCACLLLGLARAESAPGEGVPADAVLMTVDGKTVTAANADETAALLYNYGYIETYPDYDAALDYILRDAVVEKHLQEAGYYDFSDEELAAFDAEAAQQWEGLIGGYVDRYRTDASNEEEARQLRTQAEEYYASLGGSLELLEKNLRQSAAMERLQEDLMGGYVPSEDEINAIFDLYGAQYQAQYEGNVGLYEYYTQGMGYESWYVPEGYRAVIHILLTVDDDVQQAFQDAQAALEEARNAESPDEEAVKAAADAVEDARNRVLESRRDVLDEIYTRLENGEDFRGLIADYGEDPGMQDETTLSEGYHVHAESILWDPAFVEGAFQEGMQKPGDVSQPVVGQYGIHVLYYLADVPGGLIMTDSIRDEIGEYLESIVLNDAFNAGYEEWISGMEIVRNEEMIERIKAESAVEGEDSQGQ